jgi:SAM-dependent methyltransferase
MPSLSGVDFAAAFGVEALPDECSRLVREHDFRYEFATADDQQKLVLDTLKKLDANQFSVVGEHRKEVWEKGWGENLREFVASGYDAAALLPKYYRGHPFVRFRGQYIRPLDPGFEINFYSVLRTWLFRRFLADVDDIYELGCGTGLNLMLLAKLFPQKRLYGTDWARASVEIVEGLARKYGWHLKGHPLDFFRPDPAFALAPHSAVLTLTALEQVGDRHAALLDYLQSQKPTLCIHVEPIAELYDEGNLLDYLALRYHRQRGYLDKFLTALMKLESEGRIEILLARRTHFGGFYNESYSVVVWRPR